MQLRCIRFIFLFVLISVILGIAIIKTSIGNSSIKQANAQHLSVHTKTTLDFPVIDPDYVYEQLFYMSTNYPQREAGYDNNLPVQVNGHDELAAYWTQEMQKNLQGFSPQTQRDPFSIPGWQGRPAVVPAFNIEVSVPGITHPEQEVIIGCHYDGMANSTGSAYDDTSGCAIELGIAKAMATYWQVHHLYPARTLRFVAFDAEEPGMYGSFHYVNQTINGDMSNVVAMFNEDQNGIAYPLRYLGDMANPLLPLQVMMSPATDNTQYPQQSQLPQSQRDAITHFSTLMQQAVGTVFKQFQELNYQQLTYYDHSNAVSQPIFTQDQTQNIQVADDTFGKSDQMPFTYAGIPSATFEGNGTYYDANPPACSYPYDRPEDTIQLMNLFANGSTQRSQALALALAVPAMLTTTMLLQTAVLGQATDDQNPLAAIQDIGQTLVGQQIPFDASTSFDPHGQAQSPNYSWNFGDQASGDGANVSHVYTTAGDYVVILTISSAAGKRQVNKTLHVVEQATTYKTPYRWDTGDGTYNANPDVVLPDPVDRNMANSLWWTKKKITIGLGLLVCICLSIIVAILGKKIIARKL